MEISADKIQISTNNFIKLSGNVKIRYNDIELKCNKVVVQYNEEKKISQFNITEGVVVLWQNKTFKAPHVIFNITENKLLFDSGILMDDGNNKISGESGEINIKTKEVIINRVRVQWKLSIPEKNHY